MRNTPQEIRVAPVVRSQGKAYQSHQLLELPRTVLLSGFAHAKETQRYFSASWFTSQPLEVVLNAIEQSMRTLNTINGETVILPEFDIHFPNAPEQASSVPYRGTNDNISDEEFRILGQSDTEYWVQRLRHATLLGVISSGNHAESFGTLARNTARIVPTDSLQFPAYFSQIYDSLQRFPTR